MRLIVILGPYSAPTEEALEDNIENGKRIGLELIMLGYAVHCPWLDSGYATVEPIPGLNKVDIYAPEVVKKLQANTQAIIERLDSSKDAILVIGAYKGSKGTNEDLFVARKKGIPLFYDMAALLRYFPPENDTNQPSKD